MRHAEDGTPLHSIAVIFTDGSLGAIRIHTDREHSYAEVITLGDPDSGGGILITGRGADGRPWQFSFTYGNDEPKNEVRIVANANHIATNPTAALRNQF